MRRLVKIYILLVLSCIFFHTFFAASAFSQMFKKEKTKEDKFRFNFSNEKENKNSVESDTSKDDEILIETTLIINEVLVFDENKKMVENLKKEDFVVKEDGQTQEIEAFSFGNEGKFPRSIILIIDHSISQLAYLQTSIEAAENLVERLDPDDRMAIVSDDVELLQNFTDNKTLLKEKLESLKKETLPGKFGKSKQYSALMAVLYGLLAGENLHPMIIFQTDGDELDLLKGGVSYKSNLPEILDFSFTDILKATEKTHAVIYSVIPDIKFVEIPENEKLTRAKAHYINSEKASLEMRNHKFVVENLNPSKKSLELRAENQSRQQSALLKIAGFTGGWAYFLEQSEQAEKIYTEIISNMKQRYILGYYPTNQTRDGKKRILKTEVRGHPEYTVWSRESYIFGNEEN